MSAGRMWRTSSRTGNGVNCVEVRLEDNDGAVLVRDTKHRGQGPSLRLDLGQWQRLLDSVTSTSSAPSAAHEVLGAHGVVEVWAKPQVMQYGNRAVQVCWHVRQGGVELHFTAGEWTAFIAGAQDGEFDLPHRVAALAC